MVPRITQLKYNFIAGDTSSIEARYVQGMATFNPDKNLLCQEVNVAPGVEHLFIVNIHELGNPWSHRAVWVATDGDIWYPIDIAILMGRVNFRFIELQDDDIRNYLNTTDQLVIRELITRYVQEEFGDE